LNNLIEGLFEACSNGNLAGVKSILEQDLEIDIQNNLGWTPLVVAAFNQHHELVKFLLESGANVNHQSKKGTSVFMYAKTKVMESQDYSILDFLINSGADINLRDVKNDWTVLTYVRQAGDSRMEEYLMKRGATE
jgi:ankyrin repeat protein